MSILFALLFTVVPRDIVVRESVSSIVVNSFYDENGHLVFVQNIFRDPQHVQAWRLVKHPSQRPERDWESGMYTSVWFDGEFMREVRTKSVVESWTQYDPELAERERLPKEQRHELRGRR